MAVKEKDNFETVKVTAKVPRKDKDGKRVKEVADGKKVTVYDTVEKEIKKDMPSRLHARRQMLKVLYPVTEVPDTPAGRKKGTQAVTVVIQESSKLVPVRVMRRWKWFLSWYKELIIMPRAVARGFNYNHKSI